MEKARKGDIKAAMLKAKMMKPSKGLTIQPEQSPMGMKADPVKSSMMLSADQPDFGGMVKSQSPDLGGMIKTNTPAPFKISKPKLEGVVELGPTEKVEKKYTPVQDYFKKKGNKK